MDGPDKIHHSSRVYIILVHGGGWGKGKMRQCRANVPSSFNKALVHGPSVDTACAVEGLDQVGLDSLKKKSMTGPSFPCRQKRMGFPSSSHIHYRNPAVCHVFDSLL